MFQKTDDEQEFEQLVKENSASIMGDYKKSFAELEETMTIVLKAEPYLQSHSNQSLRLFWNAAGFIIVSSYDLKVIAKELTFAEHEWSKRLFARQVCHLVYELMNDLMEITGKEFKKLIETLPDSSHLTQQLKQIKASLNEFKGLHGEDLKKIRNVSAAHRDQDAFVQMKAISSIDLLATIRLMTEFDKILNSLGELIQHLLVKADALKNNEIEE